MIFEFNSNGFSGDGFEDQLLPETIGEFSDSDLEWTQIGEGRHAAVGVLFIPGSNGVAEVVITKRSTTVKTHKGQISFVGGHREQSDRTVFDTVKREIQEEIGLAATAINAHGLMKPIPSLKPHSFIYPVILSANVAITGLSPNDGEVAEIYSVPWTALKSEESQPFSFNIFGKRHNSQFFKYKDLEVWGLTAGILHLANFS